MTVQYRLPDVNDLDVLTREYPIALTIYVPTSPVASEREVSQMRVKSAFASAIRSLEAAGVDRRDVVGAASDRDDILADARLWGSLSRSLAIFAGPGVSEVFVLPNRLDEAVHTGTHFDVGQLLRSTSVGQEAFAITLSGNEWALWHATGSDRAAKVGVPDAPTDAREDLDLGNGGDRDRGGRGVDDSKKLLLEDYARRVADAVWQALNERDPNGRVPLFVFAAEPLRSMFEARKEGRRVVGVPGASDRLAASDIDSVLRDLLSALGAADTEAALRALDDKPKGRVERDLAAIARGAIEGSVAAFYFDFTSTVPGHFDAETGALSLAEDGAQADDVLSQLAVAVLRRGGKSIAVRGEDLDSTVWKGPAIADLRYALT
ncbi:hypothetical protein WDJ51_15475 [Rathayibacter sp. YIM 133350]|uniref:baeRF11 domain-containing protein n=1 Tax=Rathayibacter sp. YIM 133350 TaxID=3131992 RepID=UPI00307D85D5